MTLFVKPSQQLDLTVFQELPASHRTHTFAQSNPSTMHRRHLTQTINGKHRNNGSNGHDIRRTTDAIFDHKKYQLGRCLNHSTISVIIDNSESMNG